ncbi:MAG: hypothetical protein ACRC9V_06470, partial [Aeromonas sp.]
VKAPQGDGATAPVDPKKAAIAAAVARAKAKKLAAAHVNANPAPADHIVTAADAPSTERTTTR